MIQKKFAAVMVYWNKKAIEYKTEAESKNGWGTLILAICPNEKGTGIQGGVILGIEGYIFIKEILDVASQNLPKQRETARLTLRDDVDYDEFLDALKKPI